MGLNRTFIKRGAALLMADLLAVSCVWEKTDQPGDIRVGDPLPTFSIVVCEGGAERVVTTADLKGAVSVITLFSVTCPDCRATLPELQRAYDAFAPQGVQFINISRAEGRDRVEALWAELGLTMPYSAQDDRTVYELFAKSVVPRVYLSDRQGIVRYIHTDSPNPDFTTLQTELNALPGR